MWGVDHQQEIRGETGIGWRVAVEKNDEDIVVGESDEWISVGASRNEERTDEEYKAEANEMSWLRDVGWKLYTFYLIFAN